MSEDHDLLIGIRSDVGYIKSWTESHQKEDDERYKELKGMASLGMKLFYGCAGVYIVLNILSPFLKQIGGN